MRGREPALPEVSESPADRMMAAAAEFTVRLALFADAVDTYRRSAPDVALPESLVQMAQYLPYAELDLDAFAQALDIVESRIPVASASRKGILWQGPQPAHQIVELAARAMPGDADYRTQMERNAETKQRRDAARAVDVVARCGRPTKTTNGLCGHRRAYVPGKGYDEDGMGCSTHLEKHEREWLRHLYDIAVRENDCPGCVATKGHGCFVDEADGSQLRAVDGAWPTAKSFEGVSVHTARLDLVKH